MEQGTAEHLVVFGVAGPQGVLEACPGADVIKGCWNSLSAPSCWVELRHVYRSAAAAAEGSERDATALESPAASRLPRFQSRHSHDTMYREAAVLQDANTLGPLPPGDYELRLAECYGGVDGDVHALVRGTQVARTRERGREKRRRRAQSPSFYTQFTYSSLIRWKAERSKTFELNYVFFQVPTPKDFSFELRDDGSVVAAADDGDEAPPGIAAVTFSLAALGDGDEAAAHEESANRLSANATAAPHSFYSSSGGILSAAAASNAFPVLAAGASLVMIVLSVTRFALASCLSSVRTSKR